MESGKNIHQEKTTGCQSTSVGHNNRLALGPFGAYRIEYRRGQPVHTRALAFVTLLFTSTINTLEVTVLRVTVAQYNLA